MKQFSPRAGMGYGFAVLLAAATVAGAATVGFRGDSGGVYPNASLPTAWKDGSNILWKVKMPSWSNGSPAPVGGKVFTCAEPFWLIAVDAETGEILWQAKNDYAETMDAETAAAYAREKTLLAEHKKAREPFDRLCQEIKDDGNRLHGKASSSKTQEAMTAVVDELAAKLERVKTAWCPPLQTPTPLTQKYTLPGKHGGTGNTTATPVSDGRAVWAVFGSGVVACYEMDGKRKWIRLASKRIAGRGQCASPRLAAGKLIVSFTDVHALDPETGETLWQAGSAACHGSPAVASVGDMTVVVTASGQTINAADGKVLASGLGGLANNSPVVVDGVAYFIDNGNAAAYRIPASIEPDAKLPRAWHTRAVPGGLYASPACRDGLVYGVTDRGVLFILDAETGQKIKDQPLRIGGTCYTSLAVAGDHVIAGSEGGDIALVECGREAKVVARHKVGKLRSSPAVAGNRLYLRTFDHLYCIGVR